MSQIAPTLILLLIGIACMVIDEIGIKIPGNNFTFDEFFKD
jgi:hypothetical protein